MPAVVTRFAPSPTGFLHIGGARTALFNWLFARGRGGRMLLRIEDTDRARSTEPAIAAILDGLTWLGLDWDGDPVSQYACGDRHREVVETLLAAGDAYRCYCTAEELEAMRARALAEGRSLRYEGTWRDRDPAEFPAERPYAIRFRAPDSGETVIEDRVQGRIVVQNKDLDDLIILRSDGSPTYNLSVVVDDHDMGVSHVIRGEDHVSNTAAQIQLFEALGATPPDFAHHSLLVAADGGRLSKRSGALSVRELRAAGFEAMAVVSFAATIGTSEPVAPHQRIEELIARFDFSGLSRSPARFDPAELAALNAKLLQGRAHEDVRDGLEALGVGGGAAFWHAVRGNVGTLADARRWWDIATGDIAPVIDDRDFCAEAAGHLPDEPWTEETWRQWTDAVGQATKRSGRLLYAPLRLALTGEARGPELGPFLPFIGRERALERLTADPRRRRATKPD